VSVTTVDGSSQATGADYAQSASTARRTELAAFLRSRRERISPEDVGLPVGTRRRTAGLRREELAQLAGVGVTWYTWLEQGRPINASVQVLDAISRTLRLDATERGHLFRLADVPGAAAPADCPECTLPPEVQRILDAMPYPASVVTERFDLIAWNRVYAALFPRLTQAPPSERNTLLSCLIGPACCSPVPEQDKYSASLIAQLRVAYGRHVGDPAWEEDIRRLCGMSREFADLWSRHEVADPEPRVRTFIHATAGPLTFTATELQVPAMPDARLTVYTPGDERTKAGLPLTRRPG